MAGPAETDRRETFFPDSLCHDCAAPPRFIVTERSTFLFCPLWKRYPPQPVRTCEKFVAREPAPENIRS